MAPDQGYEPGPRPASACEVGQPKPRGPRPAAQGWLLRALPAVLAEWGCRRTPRDRAPIDGGPVPRPCGGPPRATAAGSVRQSDTTIAGAMVYPAAAGR